jgi:hypothetical protein
MQHSFNRLMIRRMSGSRIVWHSEVIWHVCASQQRNKNTKLSLKHYESCLDLLRRIHIRTPLGTKTNANIATLR